MVRSATDQADLNLRAMPIHEDPLNILDDNSTEPTMESPPTFNPYIYSVIDQIPGILPADIRLPRFSVEDLIGRTFLLNKHDEGQRLRTEIVRKINDQDAENHQNIKLPCKVGDEGAEEIMTYQELCDIIEEQDA